MALWQMRRDEGMVVVVRAIHRPQMPAALPSLPPHRHPVLLSYLHLSVRHLHLMMAVMMAVVAAVEMV